MASSTGNLSTVTFASGFVGTFVEIGEHKQSRGKIADDDLSSTIKEYLPEDLPEPGEREFRVRWNSDSALPGIDDDPELITVSHKLDSGQTTKATSAGTGFVTEVTLDPKHANNETKEGTIKIAFDGKTTPPAYTPAT